jgi:glycine/D-amino acid oxidase-like deaminating enzyme
METPWELKIKRYPKLDKNIEADVVIVGGGLAGIWCAYLLSVSGKRVVLLEKDRIGKGQTLYTTAFINQHIDTSLSELVKIFDKNTARLVWQSGADAIRLIDEVIKEEDIECEFGYFSSYIYAHNKDDYKFLREEHRLAKELGFDTAIHKDADIPVANYGALEIKNQAKYHPVKFLQGLLAAAESYGLRVFEKTEVFEVVGTRPVKVVTKDGCIIEAKDVVVATYYPFNNPKATHYKKGMYTSYCLELSIDKGSSREGMYMDTHNPYHYVRIDSTEDDTDRMIVGGEDHRKELHISANKSFKALRQFVESSFPDLRYREVRKWRGGILEPSDGLALIGETARHQYVATAFSGNGMTYSAIAGMVIRALILGKGSEYKDIYDPKRKLDTRALLYKARDYTGEFFGGAFKNIFK